MIRTWFPNARSAPEMLAWKGSHLAVRFSPDGRFVVTSMQEPGLHGWRLSDRKDLRMSGYSARVRSLAFAADGKSLATSGANQLVVWPFQGKDGPLGKAPRLFAPAEFQVEAVACHPRQAIVAAGYADGLVLLVRLDDGAEILARKPAAAPRMAKPEWSIWGEGLGHGIPDVASAYPGYVVAGLGPAIHVLAAVKARMRGTSPRMTVITVIQHNKKRPSQQACGIFAIARSAMMLFGHITSPRAGVTKIVETADFL